MSRAVLVSLNLTLRTIVFDCSLIISYRNRPLSSALMSLTPPVENNGFAYAGDAFYAQASDHHRHRRATLLELKQLFQPAPGTMSNIKDPPAHW